MRHADDEDPQLLQLIAALREVEELNAERAQLRAAPYLELLGPRTT